MEFYITKYEPRPVARSVERADQKLFEHFAAFVNSGQSLLVLCCTGHTLDASPMGPPVSSFLCTTAGGGRVTRRGS